MKTINNNNQENRNNQVSQALLRSAAVVVSVVLLSFTVSAQGLWKQLLTYNSFGKMAMLMVSEAQASEEPATAETSAFNFEQATDEALEVESWMTDDTYFGAYNNFFEVATDEPLELEEWMTNGACFANRIVCEKDEDLKLEAWMTDDYYWAF